VIDPIDDALKAVARAEASCDFAARVRARIDADGQVRVAWWPRVATACAAVVLIAALAWWVREEPMAPEHVSGPVAPASVARAQPPAPQLEPRTRTPDVAGSAPVVGVAHSVGRARPTRARASDHDRALPPLPPLDSLSVSSIAPDAMVLGEQVVTPLAPIAPISASHGEAGDDERGKL
jgi:hypothetical protein